MTVTTQDQDRGETKTTVGAMKNKKPTKRRNAPAASLANPRYRARVVRSAKVYSRKTKTRPGESDDT